MPPCAGWPRTWLMRTEDRSPLCSMANTDPFGSTEMTSPARFSMVARPRSDWSGVVIVRRFIASSLERDAAQGGIGRRDLSRMCRRKQPRAWGEDPREVGHLMEENSGDDHPHQADLQGLVPPGMTATIIQSTTGSHPIRGAASWLITVEKVLLTRQRKIASPPPFAETPAAR